MKFRILGSTALLVLAACDAGSSENVAAADNAQQPPATERLETMAEGQRNAVFIRAIRDAGLECQHVASSTPAGTYENMPVWTATCDGGQQWTIVANDQGYATILDAEQAKLVQP